MTASSEILPVGQRATSEFLRWGPPACINSQISLPAHLTLSIGGDVQIPCDVRLDEISTLPRYENEASLHCVTTWTRSGLCWSGFRFADFYEGLIAPRTHPHPDSRHLELRGIDGYRTSLPLEDALKHDVLLADRLNGKPLSVDHGAPIRLVAPSHYAYKSIKHLSSVELLKAPRKPILWRQHPRGRVALEERGLILPGWTYRWIYRTMLPGMLWYVRRAAEDRRRTGPP